MPEKSVPLVCQKCGKYYDSKTGDRVPDISHVAFEKNYGDFCNFCLGRTTGGETLPFVI